MNTKPLSKWKMAAFAMGNFGWCIATFSYSILITYFYYPPVVDGTAEIPEFISRSPVLFGATIVGLIYAFNRILDAVSDPIIANLSDRSTSRFGRRRFFMMLSFIPTALASAAIFYPPVSESSGMNVLWLIGCCVVVTISLTMYCVPYMSLMPELGKTGRERVLISTFCSVTWALGFAAGQLVWVIKDNLQNSGYTPVEAMQMAVAFFSLLGIIGMLIPILAINEDRDCHKGEAQRPHENQGMFSALKNAMQNRNFAIFTVSNGLAFMSRFFLEVGAIYYITMLMGLPESNASMMMMTLFGLSFVLYPVVVKLSKHYTKKSLFRFALAAQGTLLITFSLCSYVPQPDLLGWSIIVLFSFPLAILGIIPNVIVSDLALSDTKETGHKREALFFGANMFAYKAATSLTALIFPSLIIIGSLREQGVSPEPTEFGVTMTALIAGLLAYTGVWLMRKYDEHHILETIGEAIPSRAS
ncbi:MFS transporter [Vibrio sp. JC009]|uniref:MFS transporter n=1 Tax=Vibrio sp. JC009 TaxID=2912314 RepID=UPI0023B13B31|nr:MFS transporter [Vibrio sp. JC009]WED24775.1 MFS transporter [Vibrio sp. JC009]